LNTFKGLYLYHTNNNTNAFDHYCNANKYSSSLLLHEWEKGYLYYLISFVGHELRKDSIVIYYLQKAQDIFEKQKNSYMFVLCKLLAGLTYKRFNKYDEAKEAFALVFNYADASNNIELLYEANHYIGVIYSFQGKSREAIEHFEKNFNLKENVSSLNNKLKTIYHLVDEYNKLKAPLQSLYWLEVGNELIKDSTNQTEYEIHLNTYAFLLAGKNNTDEFKLYIRDKALPYFKKRNQWECVAHYANLLADYYQRQIKYKKAAQYFQTSNKALQKLLPNFKEFPNELELNITNIKEHK
jgi:tetratricopeptide (TPR) repeat protein